MPQTCPRRILFFIALATGLLSSAALADTVKLQCKGDNPIALAQVDSSPDVTTWLDCRGAGRTDQVSGISGDIGVTVWVSQYGGTPAAVCRGGMDRHTRQGTATLTCRHSDGSRAVVRITR